jgi:hypothetical protein
MRINQLFTRTTALLVKRAFDLRLALRSFSQEPLQRMRNRRRKRRSHKSCRHSPVR